LKINTASKKVLKWFIKNILNNLIKMKKYKIVLIILIGLLFMVCKGSYLHAQNVNSTDLSKVQVDQLTDDQVKAIIKKANMSGMSEDEIEVAAKAKGMPSTEILKLKARISSLKLTSTTTDDQAVNRNRDTKSIKDSITKETNSMEGKIFGFSLFTNKNLSFEPSTNIATPLNYQLGPGDKLIIDVWGASQETYDSKITAEGNIIISNVGPIYISGMTIEEATVKIKKELSSIYTGLLTGNTFMKISLGAVRSIKVNIVGDVAVPGTYTLSSLATVLNALYLAGGPSIDGSLRDVKIIRNNKTISTIDFYEFLLRGVLPENIRLQDEDIIFVSTYSKRVEIKGEAKRTGFFDMKPAETTKDLIYFAGGYTGKAYSNRIKIFRKTGKEIKVFDIPASQQDTFKLINGDEIRIGEILDLYENRVTIKGAVMRPGVFALDSSLTLGQLISKADGLKGDAFKNRISVYRLKTDLTEEVIPLSLTDSVKSYGFKLQKEDMVLVPSIFDITENYNLDIEGEVKNPGKYPYATNTTVEDLIIQAGGLLESASFARLEVARRIKDNMTDKTSNTIAEVYQFPISKDLLLSDTAKKFALEPYDQIFIRKSPVYSAQANVKIEGEVIFPGFYSIATKSERISDLIKRAGSLTPEAFVKGARLIRQISPEKQLQLKDLEELKQHINDSTKDEYTSKTTSTIGINLEKILKKPGSKYDLFLQEGDVIRVPKEPQTVGLSGALLFPTDTRFIKGKRLRSYISNAGGFTEDAKPSKIYVINENGMIRRTHKILLVNNYPKIEPGAEIVVPKKPERRKMTTTEAVGFGTAMSSMALIIITIINALKP
jgi:protein involved in polysaccharide export with SLBB domain